ncbi:MAG TPA: hypothetical protein VGR15_11390 [Bacteroidota bacterium]|nr:hypothetical protein [Bacteroidota bacterium]
MKRVLFIALLELVVCGWLLGQITSLGGSLRYEQQYQDFLFDDQLATSIRSNPILDLGVRGIVLSPRLFDFTLRTSLNLNFGTSHIRDITLTNQQSNWNTYDVAAGFFQYSPIKVQVAARDFLIDTKSSYNGASSNHGRTRTQEQRANFGIDRIPFLPSIHASYTRNHSWSLTGDPQDQLSNQLSFGVSSASGHGASVSVSGSFSDVKERYTGFQEKNSFFQLSGSKELSANHRIDLNSEYYVFPLYRVLYALAGYTGMLTEKVRLSSGISGAQSSSSGSTFRSIGGSQGVSVTAGDHYRFGLSVSGNAGRYSSLSGQTASYSGNMGGSATIQHVRMIGTLNLTNALSMGYAVRDYGQVYHVWEGGISNGISTGIGSYAISGSYNLSAQSTRNDLSWNLLSNNASLSANGTVFGKIRSQSSFRFRADTYGGDIRPVGNQRTANLTHGFTGQFFYYIPMTVGLGGSVNWYSAAASIRTYAWHFTFSSTSFFLRALYATYRYSRTFDPYYQRELVEQAATFDYQWRALSFHIAFRHSTTPNRIRDILFTVSRPF